MKFICRLLAALIVVATLSASRTVHAGPISGLLSFCNWALAQLGAPQKDPTPARLPVKSIDFGDSPMAVEFKKTYEKDLNDLVWFLEKHGGDDPYDLSHATLSRVALQNQAQGDIYLLKVQRQSGIHSTEIFAFTIPASPESVQQWQNLMYLAAAGNSPFVASPENYVHWQKVDMDRELVRMAFLMGMEPTYEMDEKGKVTQRGFDTVKAEAQTPPTLANPKIETEPVQMIPTFKVRGGEIGLVKEGTGKFFIPFKIDQPKEDKPGDYKYTVYWTEIDNVVDTAILETGMLPALEIKFSEGSMSCKGCSLTYNRQRSGLDLTMDASLDQAWMGRFEQNLKLLLLEIKKDPLEAYRVRSSSRPIGLAKRKAVAAEDSGFSNLDEAKAALGWSQLNGGTAYSLGGAWHADWPWLKSDYDNQKLVLLSIDGRYYSEFGGSLPSGENALYEARQKPLVPVKMEKGDYLVYFEHIRDAAGSWGDEKYALFKTEDLAQNFVKTHRFVMEAR